MTFRDNSITMTGREKHPKMFLEDRNVDPQTRSGRTVPLKILVLSMPRAGTMCKVPFEFFTSNRNLLTVCEYLAVQAALEILGYGPTIHSLDSWMHMEESKMWIEGVQAKYFPAQRPALRAFTRTEFDQLLGDCEVVSGFPSIAFSEDLIAAYPEAKVIIVQRDAITWYKSFHAIVIERLFDPVVYTIMRLDKAMVTLVDLSRWLARGKFRSHTKKELVENAQFVYLEHYEMIRRLVPKERLLDFKLSEAWEPLCRFLGREIPKGVEFPRLNDEKDSKKRINLYIQIVAARALKRVVWLLGSAGIGLLGIWLYLK